VNIGIILAIFISERVTKYINIDQYLEFMLNGEIMFSNTYTPIQMCTDVMCFHLRRLCFYFWRAICQTLVNYAIIFLAKSYGRLTVSVTETSADIQLGAFNQTVACRCPYYMSRVTQSYTRRITCSWSCLSLWQTKNTWKKEFCLYSWQWYCRKRQ